MITSQGQAIDSHSPTESGKALHGLRLSRTYDRYQVRQYHATEATKF